jgi:hypothetical protein
MMGILSIAHSISKIILMISSINALSTPKFIAKQPMFST